MEDDKPYKQYRQSWFVDKNPQVMKNGENRQKPVYEVVVGWLGLCHADLSEQRLMSSGLLHPQSGFNSGPDFVSRLTRRLKELLLITDDANYDRDMKVSYILTFTFTSRLELEKTIKYYINLFKKW